MVDSRRRRFRGRRERGYDAAVELQSTVGEGSIISKSEERFTGGGPEDRDSYPRMCPSDVLFVGHFISSLGPRIYPETTAVY